MNTNTKQNKPTIHELVKSLDEAAKKFIADCAEHDIDLSVAASMLPQYFGDGRFIVAQMIAAEKCRRIVGATTNRFGQVVPGKPGVYGRR
jgi:hypothetical protein